MSVERQRHLLRDALVKVVLAVGVVGLVGLLAPEGSKAGAIAAALALVIASGWKD